METIKLSDGTVVSGHCIEDDNALYLYLDEKTVIEGITLISGKTNPIEEDNHGVHHTYVGYTEIYAVSHEFGNCNVVLKRG